MKTAQRGEFRHLLMIRKRTFFLFINGLSVLTLGILPFGQNLLGLLSNSIFNQLLTYILITHAPETVLLCGAYSASYSIIPSWLFTRKERNRLKKKFIERIHSELLDGNADTHRVTLFREVGYLRVFIRNYCNLFRHLFSNNRWRWNLYLLPPQYGKYLIVDVRCGRPYQNNSSTMFRVEPYEEKDCDGIAGYIRFSNSKACITDLPDISQIEFKNYKNLEEVAYRPDKKKIREYMEYGYIKEFTALRKMHSRARHFLGTVINNKDGSPSGVLLIDSVANSNPFNSEIEKRFNSFAISVYDIVNWEA
ncbi:MAG: hypothetical protein H3C68_06005 [Deltaproteobacteria bacterium]|nr:hypothetical protein [Deltaproteobacteria bacterium]MBZ0220283.1 hypothetical protein [Deltaproteobacteria bacterium]